MGHQFWNASPGQVSPFSAMVSGLAKIFWISCQSGDVWFGPCSVWQDCSYTGQIQDWSWRGLWCMGSCLDILEKASWRKGYMLRFSRFREDLISPPSMEHLSWHLFSLESKCSMHSHIAAVKNSPLTSMEREHGSPLASDSNLSIACLNMTNSRLWPLHISWYDCGQFATNRPQSQK